MDFPQLTENQRRAVEAPVDRPVKISAGAGTGKTMVLTARYLELLKRGFWHSSILALTFTRKAAAEMRIRIFNALRNPRDILDTNIHNFDSFFLSILTANPLESGIDRNVKVLAGVERDVFIENVLRKALTRVEIPPLSPHAAYRLAFDAFKAVDEARMHLIELNEFLQMNPFAEEGDVFTKLAGAIYREYQQALADSQTLDFAEISIRCRRLLRENPQLKEMLKRRFRYILLDEVQDTNPAQFILLSDIARKNFANVTAVGDDKQSIYGFRGAEIDNLRDFPGTPLFLTDNFRSPQTVLELAHKLICQDPYFASRKEEIRLISSVEPPDSPQVVFHRAKDLQSEALFAAGEIASLIGKGAAPEDIALLSRARGSLKIFEIALEAKGIHFHTVSGGYFDREEIKDIAALLRFIVTPTNRGALSRLLIRPPLNLSFDRIADIIGPAAEKAESGTETAALSDVRNLALSKTSSLPALLALILNEADYYRSAAASSDPVRSLVNIEKLLRMAEDFSMENPSRGLEEFVEYLETYLLLERRETEPDVSRASGVSLLTIHQAKGLEWPVVFAVELGKPRPGRKPCCIFNPTDMTLHHRTNHQTGEDNPLYYKALEDTGKMESILAEEIRLQYVAVTRARRIAYLCSRENRGFPPVIDSPELFLESGTYSIRDKAADIPQKISGEEINLDRILDDVNTTLQGLAKAPPPADSSPLKLNFTAVNDYLKCPRRYEYYHLFKLGNLPADNHISPDDVDHQLLGSLVHKILAADPGLKNNWRETLVELYKPLGALPILTYKFVRCIDKLLDNYRAMGLCEREVVWTEKPFTLIYDLGDRLCYFSGIIDRLEKSGDKFRLTDIKTGKTLGKEHLRGFRLQLSAYFLAAQEGALGKPFTPILEILSLNDKRVVPIEYDPDIKEIIMSVGGKIARGEFPERLGEYCEDCAFQNIIC